MGKPALAKEEKRSVNFTFRLTEKEQKKLLSLAELSGQLPGVLIREKLFKGRFPEPKKAKLDLDTYLELKRIGGERQPTGQARQLGQPARRYRYYIKAIGRTIGQDDKVVVKMIASQKIGKSFMGALNYNLKKLHHPDSQMRAELLATNFASIDPAIIKQEVELMKSMKPNLGRYVYHTSINFGKEDKDKLDGNKLLAIANDYPRESGYTNN